MSIAARAILLFCGAMLAGGSAPMAADTDPAALGRHLVLAHCSGCHASEPVGESPLALAPPLRDLHLRYDVELLGEALVEGMVTAHAEMPQIPFAPDEAAAIIAYLKSLEPAQAP